MNFSLAMYELSVESGSQEAAVCSFAYDRANGSGCEYARAFGQAR
jgi:hypothetical protein